MDTKRVDTKDFILYPGGTQSTSSTEYYVRSTVLGGKLLTELDQAGAKKLTNVYAGDGVLAEQRIIGGTPGVFWRHEDPLTSSYRKIDASGNEGGSLADSPANVEYDPLGGAIPTIDLDATAFPVTVQFPKTIPRISSRNTGKMVIGHSIVYSRPLLESAMTAACEPIFLFILVVKM